MLGDSRTIGSTAGASIISNIAVPCSSYNNIIIYLEYTIPHDNIGIFRLTC